MKAIKILKILVLGFLILGLLAFIYQHMYDVNVYLFTYTFKVPLFVLLLSFGFIGFIIPTMMFSLRERRLNAKLKSIFENSKAAFFSKYQKPKTNLQDIKDIKPLYFIFANILRQAPEYETDIYSIFEKAKNLRHENPDEAINLLNTNEYPALQLKRNIFFDKKDYTGGQEIQQLILKSTPKVEKQLQKDISNILKALISLKIEDSKGRLNSLEDAYDDSKTELNAFLYLTELLIQNKTKDASKVIQQIINVNMQDAIMLIACSNPERGVYLINEDLEKNTSKDVLGIFYIFIGAPQKIKVLSDGQSEIMNFLISAYQDKTFEKPYDIIFKSLKLWRCDECGTTYREYSPKCSCDAWFSLKPHISL